jgi:hypothetical protein
MERREARRLLEDIRVGRRYCRLSGHFEQAALEDDFDLEDAWSILRRHAFDAEPEERRPGVWRVRLTGTARDSRPARLVIDLSEEQECAYITIHAL